MLINFQTFRGQNIELEVSDNDTVLAVKEKLSQIIKADADTKLNAKQIRLYCGDDKLKDNEIFLASIDKSTVFIRLSKHKIIPKQTERNVSQYTFFSNIQHAFADTKLALTQSFDPVALQQDKEALLTNGAIPKDIMVISGHGATLNTNRGLVIDLSSQTLNCIFGLNDPWISLRKISNNLSEQPQFCTIRMGFPEYYSYAKRLSGLLATEGMPGYVINHRQCNGSDAVELAVHAAFRFHKQRKKIATFKGSYHGQNLFATLVSEHQPSLFLVEQPPQVEFFPVPDYDSNNQSVLNKSTQQTLEILRACGEEFAAILIEPFQVRNAVHQCPLEFMQALRKICDEKNICLIFDEIQTGFGWLGKLSYSGSHGVRPDIAVFSKSVTAGYGALAIMVADPKYRDVSSTFSGKTNSGTISTIVAADAVLDRLVGIENSQLPKWLPDDLQSELNTGLMEKTPEFSAKLVSFLEKIQNSFPDLIGKIKGQGLVRGLEILSSGEPDERLCAWLINKAFENGVYLRQADHVILFKPALVITQDEFEIAFRNLCKTFEEGQRYRDECKANNRALIVGKSHG